jgi:UV DNA damage repair endonuclease
MKIVGVLLFIFLIISCSAPKTTKVNIEIGVNDYATLRAKKTMPTQTGSKKVSGPNVDFK